MAVWRKVVVAVSIAIAGIALYWTLHSPPQVEQRSQGGGNVPQSEAPPQRTGPESKVVALEASPPRAAPPPKPVPAPVNRGPLREYEAATRLVDLARLLLIRAQQGDAEAAYVLALIGEECRFASTRPTWFVADSSNDPKLKARQDAFARRISRCDGIKELSDLSGKAQQFREAAAAGGYLPAKAANLSTLHISGRDADAAADAAQIIASINGDSVLGLYSYITRRNNGPVIGDPPVTVDRAAYEVGWFLTACELGLSCGAGSHMMETICMTRGGCGFASYDDFARGTMSPDQYQQATQLRARLVGALRNGSLGFFGLR